MELKMFIGKELIDTIRINPAKWNSPGYIDTLKMDMKEENEDIIDLSNDEPEFFIENVPSSMNTAVSFLKTKFN
jgi:hypothetical protein